jgi:hypothetical protein
MVFYDSGAQAGRFQTTRERLIELIGKVAQLAIMQESTSPSETPQFIGWTIFCIFQVELRRWLSHDDPNLREGMEALQRALTLFIRGMNPTENALILTRDIDRIRGKAQGRKERRVRT